jgi:hypothetical protein
MPSEVSAWLARQQATRDVVSWAESAASDFAQLWEACPRGDWMLAIAARAHASTDALCLAAAECARSCLYVLPEGAHPARDALDVLEGWARGAQPRAALSAASAAVDQVESDDPAVVAAIEAVRCALGAASDPESAAGAAANAAQAAVYSVGDCAMMPALRESQATSAARVREVIGFAQLRFT